MKKALYTLGALTAVVTPVIAVVSCGSEKQTIRKSTSTTNTQEAANSQEAAKSDFVQYNPTISGAKDLPAVGDYINKHLTLRPFAEMHLGQYGIQSMDRFGSSEIDEYNMDNGWIQEYEKLNTTYHWNGKSFHDEYVSPFGFRRFNDHFEVFLNFTPNFKPDFDYSNGADMSLVFAIKDKDDSSDSLAFWSPLKTADNKTSIAVTADQLKGMPNYSVRTAADADLATAKQAIKNITKAYSVADKDDIGMLKGYFDKDTWKSFSETFLNPNVQTYIDSHIDSIYDTWVKYPATDASSLAAMAGIMAHPTLSGLTSLVTDDHDGKKLNIINGVLLLKYIIDQAIAKGDIKL